MHGDCSLPGIMSFAVVLLQGNVMAGLAINNEARLGTFWTMPEMSKRWPGAGPPDKRGENDELLRSQSPRSERVFESLTTATERRSSAAWCVVHILLAQSL